MAHRLGGAVPGHDVRTLVAGERRHGPFGGGDDGGPARPGCSVGFQEPDGPLDLGPHAPRRELPLGEIRLRLCEGHLPNRTLRRLAPVQHDAVDAGEEQEVRCLDGRGEESGGEVRPATDEDPGLPADIDTVYCPNVGPVYVQSSMLSGIGAASARVVARLRGYALTEELPCKDGMPVNRTMRGLGVLRARHMPEVEILRVDVCAPGDPGGIRGVAARLRVELDGVTEVLGQLDATGQRDPLALAHDVDVDAADLEAVSFWNTALESAMFAKMMSTMGQFFLAVSLVTLALGGIGVMNIMLVAVKERTREIGVRKALGATARRIQWQFFSEGFAITLMSGGLGLLLGYGLCELINQAPLPPRFAGMIMTWETGALAVVALTLVGIGAALYPAARAAQLPPIEALRYE